MRTVSAKSVVVVAALAGASVSGWAKVSSDQGGYPAVLVAQAQTGLQSTVASDFGGMQPVVFYPTPTAFAQPFATRAVAAAPALDSAPGQEQGNMGLMILVGLGMVGTVMVKRNRS